MKSIESRYFRDSNVRTYIRAFETVEQAPQENIYFHFSISRPNSLPYAFVKFYTLDLKCIGNVQ